MLSSRVSEIERLVLLVETLVCILFGHSSEKILGQIEQLDLQLEELSAGDAVEERRAAPSFPGCHPAKISIPSPLRAIGPVFLGTVVSVNNVLMHQNRRLAKSASPNNPTKLYGLNPVSVRDQSFLRIVPVTASDVEPRRATGDLRDIARERSQSNLPTPSITVELSRQATPTEQECRK
jgi:hypothetical protein